MTLSFRCARAEDLDRLVELHRSAFPDRRGYDARLRNFTANPMGTLEDLWVAQEGEAIVAHAFLFPLSAWFGGEEVPMGGIAAVGVAPEARGRRVGSRLLERVQEIARARGDALVALYPYRQGYYARLGYTAVTPYRHLRFAPSALALPAAGLRVRPASVADRPAMAACWVETGRRRTGTLVRTERTWEAALSDEAITWLVADGEGGPEGLIAWTVTQRELHGATTLLVREVAATTDRAWRALWGAAAAQRDQVDEVQVDLPEDDPLPRALIDGDRIARRDRAVAHPLGLLADGPMLRLLDAPRAMAARGWPESGRVVLDLDGTRLALEASGGRATLEPTREEAVIRLDAVTLTALSFGGLRAKDAAWLGRLHARTADGLARADALLGLPAYFSSDRF